MYFPPFYVKNIIKDKKFIGEQSSHFVKILQRTLLWATDAIKSLVTRYNYNQNNLSNINSKVVILFNHYKRNINYKIEANIQTFNYPAKAAI